jgi:prepilin-type N-terminal cleavage/methylation domain-containing protein
VRDERGFTLVELVVVMAIMGFVMAGLTTIFVSGTNAQTDMNRRFVAQQQARLALTKIVTDLHCAASAQVETIASTYPGLAISEPNCPDKVTGSTTVDYCIIPSTTMSTRYALWRSAATSNRCASSDTSKVKVADYLTTNATTTSWSSTSGTNVFATVASTAQNSLELVLVDFPISLNPTSTKDVYELKDTIVARNSTRCSGTCTQSNYAVSP